MCLDMSQHQDLLRQAASKQKETPEQYIQAVADGRWGGVPEAMVLCATLGISATTWDVSGQVVYCVGKGRRVHLGYNGQHYFLLKGAKLKWQLRAAFRNVMLHLFAMADLDLPQQHGQDVCGGGAFASSSRQGDGARDRRRTRSPNRPPKTEGDIEKLRRLTAVDGISFEDEASWFILKFWGDGEAGDDRREGSWEPFCALCGKWLDRVHRLSARHQARVRDHGRFQPDAYQPPADTEDRRAVADAVHRASSQDGHGGSASSIVLLPRPDLRHEDSGRHTRRQKESTETGGCVVSGLQVSVTAVKPEPVEEGRRRRARSSVGAVGDDLEMEAAWMSWRSLDNLRERLHCDLCGVWCDQQHRSSSRHQRRLRQHRWRQVASVSEMIGDTDTLSAPSTRGGAYLESHSWCYTGCTCRCRWRPTSSWTSAMLHSSTQTFLQAMAPWLLKCPTSASWSSCMASSCLSQDCISTHHCMCSGCASQCGSPSLPSGCSLSTACSDALFMRKCESPQAVRARLEDMVAGTPMHGRFAGCTHHDQQGMASVLALRGGSSPEVFPLNCKEGDSLSPTLPFASCELGLGVGSCVSKKALGALPGRGTFAWVLRTRKRKVHGVEMKRACHFWKSTAPSDILVLAQSFEHEVPVSLFGRKIGLVSALQTAHPDLVLDQIDLKLVPSLGSRQLVGRCAPCDPPPCPRAWHWSMVKALYLCWEDKHAQSDCRGGMFRDHTVEEQCRSMEARVHQIQDIARGLLVDLDDLRRRIRSRSPRDREPILPCADHAPELPLRVAADAQGDAEPDQEAPPTLPDDLQEALAFVDLLTEQDDDLGSEGASQRSLQFSHEIVVKMGERGRHKYNVSYIEEHNTVADVHFEVARITKRASWSFCLHFRDKPVHEATKLLHLGDRINFLGVMRTNRERERACPLSAIRRGGAASSARSRMAKKLQKTSPSILEPLKLLQALWPFESRTLVEAPGQAEAFARVVHNLILKHDARLVGNEWELGNTAGFKKTVAADPWAGGADPWSAAKAPNRGSTHDGKHDFTSLEGAPVSNFEEMIVKTKFLTKDRKQLKQVFRTAYEARSDALVLCEAMHLSGFLASLEDDATVMVIINKMSKQQIEHHKASKTQLLVDDQGKERIVTAHAVTWGTTSVSAVQDAWKIDVVQSEVVWGTLRVRRDLTSDDNFECALKKDSLSEFLGKYIKHITITGRRLEENPEAVKWSLQIPRAFLTEVLAQSGRKDAIISVSREEEKKLDLQAVIVQTLAIGTLYEQLQAVEHMGLAGPTRSGALIIRVHSDHLAAVRRTVLTSNSPFSEVMDMPIKHKVQGRFPSNFDLQTVAASMTSSMGWECVGLGTKPLSKTHRLLTFGCRELPPTDKIVMGRELVLLKEMKASEETKLASTFVPELKRNKSTDPIAMNTGETEDDGVNDLIEAACDRRLATSEHMLETKMKMWQNQFKEQMDVSIKRVEEQTKLAVEAQSAKSAQDTALIREEMVKQGTMVQNQQMANAQHWDTVDQRIARLAATCEEKFGTVDRTLAEQAQVLQNTSVSLKEQFKAIGADLMSQLASMQAEHSSSNKKRRPGDDQPMEDEADGGLHRGGMPGANPEHFKQLAERLRSVLVGHDLADPLPVSSSTAEVDKSQRNADMKSAAPEVAMAASSSTMAPASSSSMSRPCYIAAAPGEMDQDPALIPLAALDRSKCNKRPVAHSVGPRRSARLMEVQLAQKEKSARRVAETPTSNVGPERTTTSRLDKDIVVEPVRPCGVKAAPIKLASGVGEEKDAQASGPSASGTTEGCHVVQDRPSEDVQRPRQPSEALDDDYAISLIGKKCPADPKKCPLAQAHSRSSYNVPNVSAKAIHHSSLIWL